MTVGGGRGGLGSGSFSGSTLSAGGINANERRPNVINGPRNVFLKTGQK